MNNFNPLGQNLPQMNARPLHNPAQEITRQNLKSSDSILYIGNIHPSIEETALYEMFRQFGEVQTCKLMKDIYSGESKGFAFITYDCKESA